MTPVTSAISASSNALCTAGRLKVTTATPPVSCSVNASRFGGSAGLALRWVRRGVRFAGRRAVAMAHILKTPKVVDSIGRLSAAEMRQSEDATRIGGIDHPVVPQPRTRVIRVAFALVLARGSGP